MKKRALSRSKSAARWEPDHENVFNYKAMQPERSTEIEFGIVILRHSIGHSIHIRIMICSYYQMM